MYFQKAKTTLLALFLVFSTTNAATSQELKLPPQEIGELLSTACLFATRNPDAELPRSHAAFKAAGLPIVTEGPTMGFYGNPANSYFISNLTDDDNISCSVVITIADLDRAGFDEMVQTFETAFTTQFGNHIFSPSNGVTPTGYNWIKKHGDGTKTVATMNFHKKNGTNIASIATTDD